MCIHSLDGLHGWTPECRDSSRCLCGLFPELRHAEPQRRPMSIAAIITLTIVAVWLVASLVCALLIFWAAARGRQTNGGQQ